MNKIAPKSQMSPSQLVSLAIVIAFAAAACGSAGATLDAAVQPDDTPASTPAGDTQPPAEAEPDTPPPLPSDGMDGTLIGSANMGGEIVDPQPHPIDSLAIAESYPEQVQVEFTAAAEGCTAATAQAFATDTQVTIVLDVGITTDALVRTCPAGEFNHILSIQLDEGLDGRDVVAAEATPRAVDLDANIPVPQPFEMSIIGLSEVNAQEAVEAQGLVWRILSRDGEFFAVTEDYSEDRVNVHIEDGVVTGAEIG